MDQLTSGYYSLQELYTVIAGLARKFHKRHPTIEVDDFYQSGLLSVIETCPDHAMIDLNFALSNASRGMAKCYLELRNPSQLQYKRYRFEAEIREYDRQNEGQSSWIMYLWSKLLTRKEREFLIVARGLNGKTPQGFKRAARQIFPDSINGEDWQLRLDMIKNKFKRLINNPTDDRSTFDIAFTIRRVKAKENAKMWKIKRNKNGKSTRS